MLKETFNKVRQWGRDSWQRVYAPGLVVSGLQSWTSRSLAVVQAGVGSWVYEAIKDTPVEALIPWAVAMMGVTIKYAADLEKQTFDLEGVAASATGNAVYVTTGSSSVATWADKGSNLPIHTLGYSLPAHVLAVVNGDVRWSVAGIIAGVMCLSAWDVAWNRGVFQNPKTLEALNRKLTLPAGWQVK